MTPIFGIFFMIGLLIGIRVVATILNNVPPPLEPCKRHTWETKRVDEEDEEMGSYLVCSTCKMLPGGGTEQS